MEKLEGKSMDIVAQNIEKLKEIFPDVFSEGKVDFEALEATLGEYVDRDGERYSFTWKGKARARRIAQTPSTVTESASTDATRIGSRPTMMERMVVKKTAKSLHASGFSPSGTGMNHIGTPVTKTTPRKKSFFPASSRRTSFPFPP